MEIGQCFALALRSLYRNYRATFSPDFSRICLANAVLLVMRCLDRNSAVAQDSEEVREHPLWQ
jgi:hypothetical protein